MTQKLQYATYDVFTALRTRTRENGLAIMPTAGPSPQPAVVVALNGGLEYDLVSYVASKRGEPPTIPAPSTTNPNRVLLKGWQSAVWPIPDMSGATRYTLFGYIVWGILNPEGLESDFMLGTLPFPGLDTNEYISASTYLSYTLLNQRTVADLPGQPTETLPWLIKQISSEG